ncbi:taste receptor type 2 member 41 [Nycticebus coucang]|uniref:taste receptor type 2 member 41 n=1 Tax=Nycticebus coucang TaxID=9470 RepID=UPI00234C26AF|nr:taste receptor type 2 member 41 [Nycticebus coucang]
MQSALTVLFMLLFLLLCLLGMLANGFIVLVLGRQWLRCGRLLALDTILISLGASRFCLQWVGLVHNFYYRIHFADYNWNLSRQLFGLHWYFLNSANFWLGAWLSVLFCLKIANITHPTFLWLKWRFPGVVPWLLLGSVLVSIIVTLLFFWGNHTLYQEFLIREFSGNMTFQEWKKRMEIHYFLPLKLVTLSMPLSIFLVSMALLICSLRSHIQRMWQTSHSLQDHSMEAHTRALQSLISFLILYALSFVSLMIDVAKYFSSESQWYWVWQIISYFTISVHPCILIFSNIKLRGTFRQLLLLAKGFWVA